MRIETNRPQTPRGAGAAALQKLAVFAALAVVGGCTCSRTAPEEGAITVQFLSPRDGAALKGADDLDPATPDMQVDVSGLARNFSGSATAALSIDGVATATVDATADQKFTFQKVTLSAGQHVLSVAVTTPASDSTSGQSGEAQANVTVETGTTGTPSLAITTPVAGTLNAAADAVPATAAFDLKTTVKITNPRHGHLALCSGAGTGPACAKAGGKVLAEKDLAGTETTTDFVAPVPEGQLDLAAELRDAATSEVFTSASVALNVDSVPPTLTFLDPTPFATVGTNPFPVKLATTAENGQQVTLTGGSAPQTATVNAGAAQLTVKTAEGAVKLVAEVSDIAGNKTRASIDVTVDTAACALAWTTPNTATVVWGSPADKDKDPANGLQIDLVATTSDCKGRDVDLFVGGTKKATVKSDATTGNATFANVTFPDGISNLPVEAQLQDPAGNLAKAGFTASVLLKAPVLKLYTDTTTRNLINDRDYSTPGVQIQALVEADKVQGGTLYLCSTIKNATSATACRSGGFIVSQTLTHTALQTSFFAVTLSDGTQTLTGEVVDSAGNVGVTPGTSLTVDSVAPSVTKVVVKEDVNADDQLNATELPTGQKATVEVTVTGAEGQNLSVYGNGVFTGTPLDTKPVSGGKATLSVALNNGTNDLVARVFSASGNPNISDAPAIANPAARLLLLVDRAAPSLAVSAPTGTFLNKSNENPATSPQDFVFTVATDAADGSAVKFFVDGSLTPTTATVTGGAASASVPLADGARTVRIEVADAAGNVTTKTLSLTVDTQAPTLAITAPTAGQSLTTYQVAVDLTAAGAEAGQLVTVTVDTLPGQQFTKAVDASGKATVTLSLANGTHNVTANVSDLAGNAASPATVSFTVAAQGCEIARVAPLGDPVKYNIADDKKTDPAGDPTNGINVNIDATTANCAGRSAELYVNNALVQTVTSSSSGAIAFTNVKFNDNVTAVPVEIRMTDVNGKTTSAAWSVSVKLTAPVLTVKVTPPDTTTTPVAPPATGITYVAASNPTVAYPGVMADLVADGNADASFDVTVTGAAGGSLTVKVAGADRPNFPRALATNNETLSALAVTFAQNTTGTATISAVDGFGNPATDVGFPVTVDVIAPAAPDLSGVGAVTLSNPRTAKVDLKFTGVGDDGTTGTPAKYELKYLTSTMAGTSLACASLDSTAYNTRAVAVTPPATAAAGTAMTATLDKLPPLNCYTIGLRAVDEVGNVSPLTNVASKANYWRETVLTGSAAGSLYGFLMRTGDLDQNGTKDLVVAARSESPAGAVYVYYGTPSAPVSNKLRLAGTSSGELFGISLAVGDLDGDGVDDVVVGASGFSSSLGRAYIYFGVKNGTIDPTKFVELRGRVAGGRFGYGLQVVDDVDGDNVKDLLVGARFDGTSGHSFLFKGRSQTQWFADRTSSDTSTTPATPYLSAADFTKSFAGTDASEQFGARDGYASIGDLDGDNKPEFTIPASKDNVNKLYVYETARVAGITGRDIVATDATVLTRTTTSTLGVLEGFGAFAVGRFDFDGDGVKDLLASHPIANQVLLYKGAKQPMGLTLLQTIAPTVASAMYFGSTFAVNDINGDGKPDLWAGNNASASVTGSSTVFLHLNNGTATALGSTADAAIRTGVTLSSVASDDFDGDGKPDLAAADQNDANGKVRVYVP